MDFVGILTNFGVGIIAASLGFLYGLGVRPGIISRVDIWIHEKIEEEINNFIDSVEKDPVLIERFVKLVRPYAEKELGRFLARMGGSEEGMKDLKIGGMKIPAWAVQLGMQFLQRGQKRVERGLMDNVIDAEILK